MDGTEPRRRGREGESGVNMGGKGVREEGGGEEEEKQ